MWLLLAFTDRSDFQKRQVLHVLWRALPWHHFQHHDAEKDLVLHGEFEYEMYMWLCKSDISQPTSKYDRPWKINPI